jgi:hypothetical protein
MEIFTVEFFFIDDKNPLYIILVSSGDIAG